MQSTNTLCPVQFDNVSKAYDQRPALHGINLSIRLNSITSIIGPSGSGKSTLLQHINGLIRPDNGVVSVFGQPIDYGQLHQLRLKIGYAVQGSGLFPHLTIERNIVLLAHLQNWPQEKIDARVDELMQLVDLSLDYKSKYPHQLSGGEQQRVGLCRAMMLKPPLFLLDEPFGALDPITRAEIHTEVQKLQNFEPRTIILVTHDLREALKLSDQVVIMNEGQIVQMAPPTEILGKPVNLFVEKFVHLQLSDSVSAGLASD